MWAWLIAALSLAASGATALDVPYLPQTEDLCGGAAVAMVYRYFGEAHADVQHFASLVDTRAGGIATDRLVESVAADGWKATSAAGSLDFLQTQLAAGIPPIILLEDRPRRYHYVVVIGMSGDTVVVHDPAVGPSRRMPAARLVEKWEPAHFWTMVILPGDNGPAAVRRTATARQGAETTSAPDDSRTSECDQLLDRGLDQIQSRGLDAADDVLGYVRQRCPASAGPVRELAGIRFAQHRWRDAAALASNAAALDPADAYAWNVLASSRFMQDDLTGSLDAWNRIGKPEIDLVHIDGVERMRYQLLARVLALTPNTVLTAGRFTRAQRRLADLPDQSSSRMSYRPAEDGFAVVEVAVAERPTLPRTPAVWAATAAQFLVEREADIALPGGTGQGELWEASWRWWSNRPRVGVSFAAPRVGRMPGVWRVDASWEEQTYAKTSAAALVRERRTRVGLTVSDWLTGNLKYNLNGGVDVWSGRRRTVSFGAGLQRRLFGERLALSADAASWFSLGSGAGFRSGSLRGTFDSADRATARWLLSATAGVDSASGAAPFALWPGAGDGHARAGLLRAHPLLEDGVIVGPAFGRTVASGSVEAQRWFDRGQLVRFGWAVFADAARPWSGIGGADGRTELDAGVGLRVRVPGAGGMLRADFAHGVRDGSRAVSVAWRRIV